jgi:hypothetical protein
MNIQGPTAKQTAVLNAIGAHPRQDQESARAWYRRIAPMAGCSAAYVQCVMDIERAARIGAEIRAREEAEAKSRCKVERFGGNVGPVRGFTSWVDAFGKFKMITHAYLNFARQRGDVYASAFLMNIADVCERAEKRAGQERD